MKNFFIISAFWLFSTKLALAQSSTTSDWLAFGDIRGFFEPCGCDPRTDLGGMTRLQAHVDRERALRPSLLVFHLGNAFSVGESDLLKQKNEYVRAALNVINPDVSLFNVSELTGKANFLPGINYVLSNLSPGAKSKTGFKSNIEVKGNLVFGFVEPSLFLKRSNIRLDDFNTQAWKKTKNLDKRFQTSKTVLLYSGSDKILNKIIQAKIFDTVISSNDKNLSATFADEERLSEAKLIRLRKDDLEVLKTPLGGQGVLRSPSLQTAAPAEPVKLELKVEASPSLFGSSSTTKTHETTAGLALNRKFVYWLEKKEEDGVSKEMLDLVLRFRAVSENRMSALTKIREEELKDSKFVGVESCKSCHAAAYDIWQKSKHAHAYQTLIDKQRTSDPECVSCHVVGFSTKGGFASEQKSPHLKDVQCESCHGPRIDHIANPSIKNGLVKAKESCAGCHTPPHSPGFEYKKYWEQIKHK